MKKTYQKGTIFGKMTQSLFRNRLITENCGLVQSALRKDSVTYVSVDDLKR